MIDEKAIVEIINNILPIAVSSPVLVKLISVVENVIKTLYAPILTFKNGKAEVDVEIYRQQQGNALLSGQTFTLYEITKLKNFVHTAQFANEELQNDDFPYDDEQVDFDWIMRFFDAVSNISNSDMQKLWGKVLAGEIRHPGICSLRTIDIIRNMSVKEAKYYNELCKYVLISGDCYFICAGGFSDVGNADSDAHAYMQNKGLNYSDTITPIIESGLLSVANTIATDFATNNVLKIQNEKLLCLVISNNDKNNFMEIDSYLLTTSGIELYNIIKNTVGFELDKDYNILCFKELKHMYPNLKITVHRVIDENDISENIL